MFLRNSFYISGDCNFVSVCCGSSIYLIFIATDFYKINFAVKCCVIIFKFQSMISRQITEIIFLVERFNAVIIIGLLRGIIKPSITQEQGMAWVCEALQECSTAAKPYGVRLALEPINRYETTLVNSVAHGMALIDRVGADNFGLLLDTFHMNIEEPDILQSISTCGDRIFHFHVADSNRWYPGAGHLDFSGILSRLQSTGYDGFVSGEFMPLPDPLTAARENFARLRAILSSRELNPHPVTRS